ncbi:methionine synthase [Chloroflexota bacterium]
MAVLEFNCLPTIISSMPGIDPAATCRQIAKYLPDIPSWPQLPQRAFTENMYAQFSEGFPGIVIGEGSIKVDTSVDLTPALEKLYTAYINNELAGFGISAEYAAGLRYFLGMEGLAPRLVKGQVTGPVTWAATVTDEDGRSVIWNDVLCDAAARMLRLKAAWQCRELKKICKDVIVFLDEPYLEAYGSSAFISLSHEKVIGMLNEVFGGIGGYKGVHCCGNTDWAVLLATELDILSFDAYNYADTVALYPAEVKKLIDRGGALAWGIVPTDPERLARESVTSLKDRLEDGMAPFTRQGIPFETLCRRAILTPSCGMAMLPTDAVEAGLGLLSDLSALMGAKYS